VSDAVIVIFMYAIGSIPFAYIMSLRAGVDLREHGSRNIGARNAFEVTKRRDIGISVLILDILKGLFPTLLLDRYMNEPSILPLAIVALVIGHCYSVWLRFHGGRGLATAAGILLVASPIVLASWLLGYVLAKVISNNIHLRAVIALCIAAATTFVLNDATNLRLIYQSKSYESFGIVPLEIAFVLMIAVIFTRHIRPLVLTLKQ
jgi:acyl phosphate:glycerol-3-phosphate acyltransferase